MILIRNSPHKNGIYTYIDNLRGYAIKSSHTITGIACLLNELNGYNWYLERINHKGTDKPAIISIGNTKYTRLYIELFEGNEGVYSDHISKNKINLELAIYHYFDIWPTADAGLFPMHGDFSLGNIFYTDKSLKIIDWEHFKMNAAPWGFDLSNLLYEALFFSFNRNNTLAAKDVEAFTSLYRLINSKIPTQSIFNLKLQSLQDFLFNNEEYWGDRTEKLPVLKFNKAQSQVIKNLESLII
jgi:thiamine kinase-like enzyme